MTSTTRLDIDYLRPKTVWIGKRCYRILGIDTSSSNVNYAEYDSYMDQSYEDNVECPMDQEDISVKYLENGKVQSCMQIPKAFYSYIIGVKGATKKRIEMDTYTQIRIPSKGQDGDIVVIGRDVKCIREARIKLDLMVENARKRQPFTHFVSIPFNGKEIQEEFGRFMINVLEKCPSRGIDETIFQSPAKLHLTICVCALMDDRERQLAISTLHDVESRIKEKYFSSSSPFVIRMRGIEYMNDDPGEVDVLYGKVESENWANSLQDLANDVRSSMVAAGVMQKRHDSDDCDVKLHVTLLNTLFRRGKETFDVAEVPYGGKKERETFDARDVLKEFIGYDFGQMQINEVHLSIRYSTSETSGYYASSAKIDTL